MSPLAQAELYVIAAALGSVVGSFATTAAQRISVGRNWAGGRSSCDACSRGLGYAETVPILSFAWLGGRCRFCGAKISRTLLAGEVLGLVVAVAAISAPAVADQVWLAGAGFALIFVGVLDLHTYRIPNAANFFLLLVGLLSSFAAGKLLAGVICGVATYLILWIAQYAFLRFRGRQGLGGGDVKLLAALAVWLGGFLTPWAVVLSATLALAWTWTTRTPSRSALPFGPFIAVGSWLLACVACRIG